MLEPFLGILLCGYLGEKIGWSYGFGLAGIFMLFGLIQFWLAQNIFGHIGLKPKKDNKIQTKEVDTDKRVPFTRWQLGIIVISVVLGILGFSMIQHLKFLKETLISSIFNYLVLREIMSSSSLRLYFF